MAGWKRAAVKGGGGYVRATVLARINELRKLVSALEALGRPLTEEELKLVHELRHLEGVWTCQFSNR